MADDVKYKMVDLKDGVIVQYVGVYVLKWKPEWGQPSVGFVEINEEDEDCPSPPKEI